MSYWHFSIIALLLLDDAGEGRRSQVHSRYILDIGRNISSLWMSLAGGFGKEKILEVVFGILLRVPGVSSMTPRMIRG